MKRILTLALVLAVLAMGMAALAEKFQFRNGVTWGMTPDEVMRTEGFSGEVETYTIPDGYSTDYLMQSDAAVAGVDADASYIFVQGDLVACGYTFSSNAISYEKLKKALTSKYGESAGVDIERINALAAVFGGRFIAEGESASWSLDDGTQILLADGSPTMELIYLDVPGVSRLADALNPEEEEFINTSGL